MILDCETEKLAKELHKFYRAAMEALHTGRNKSGSLCLPKNCIFEHAHGWHSCHKKQYFLRRAKLLTTSMNNRDFTKLPAHMQSIQNAS